MTIESAIEARTAELKLAIRAAMNDNDMQVKTGPYTASLRIVPGGDVWLDGDYPELVDMGDAGCWGRRLESAIGCLARAIACAERGHRPALST